MKCAVLRMKIMSHVRESASSLKGGKVFYSPFFKMAANAILKTRKFDMVRRVTKIAWLDEG